MGQSPSSISTADSELSNAPICGLLKLRAPSGLMPGVNALLCDSIRRSHEYESISTICAKDSRGGCGIEAGNREADDANLKGDDFKGADDRLDLGEANPGG